jgi:hypothetical protein
MSVDNLADKHCFIVVTTVNGDDLPACVGKQKKDSGDGEPAPWRPRRDDPDKVRRAEVSEDFLAKQGRHFLRENAMFMDEHKDSRDSSASMHSKHRSR